MTLKLMKPTLAQEQAFLTYQQEFFQEGMRHIPGCGGLEKVDVSYPFPAWLRKIEADSADPPQGRIPAMLYALVDDNDTKIIGMLQLRLELNDYLFNFGGHIGYSIVASERNQGYGTKILTLGLQKVKDLKMDKVLVTCNIENRVRQKSSKKMAVN